MSSKKVGLYLVLAGIVVLALKLSINTGLSVYPAYATDYTIGREFQVYTLNYFYGANGVTGEISMEEIFYTGFRIDIFSNILGYLLVIVGASKLSKVSKSYTLSAWVSYIGLALTVAIKLLPFLLNGYKLCYVVLCVGIAELFATLSVSYLFVYAICMTLNDMAFRSDRAYIGVSYIGMAACMIVVAFVSWVAAVSSFVLLAYELIYCLVIGILLFNIYKLRDYITQERSLE